MRKLLLLIGFFIVAPGLVIFSSFFLLFFLQQQIPAINSLTFRDRPIAYAALPSNINVVSDFIQQDDSRVGRVTSFLASFNSPLTPYASLIVASADHYGIDYRLLPAIGAQESGECNKEITGTHNCWGYGIYGGKITRFDNYEEAINTITRYFAKKRNSGVSTLEEIGSIYNPSNHNNWISNVASFMNLL